MYFKTVHVADFTSSDDNDNPPVFTENPYQFEAPEDTPVGTSVGQISASDADTRSAGIFSNLLYHQAWIKCS